LVECIQAFYWEEFSYWGVVGYGGYLYINDFSLRVIIIVVIIGPGLFCLAVTFGGILSDCFFGKNVCFKISKQKSYLLLDVRYWLMVGFGRG